MTILWWPLSLANNAREGRRVKKGRKKSKPPFFICAPFIVRNDMCNVLRDTWWWYYKKNSESGNDGKVIIR